MSVESDITVKDEYFIGEDKEIGFTIADQTLANSPPAGDISAWTVVFEVSAAFSGDKLFSVLADTASQGASSIALVTIAKALTVNLPGDTQYWYTLRRTDPTAALELAFGTLWLRDVFVNYDP